MSTPTGFLAVLDAGDCYSAIRYFVEHYGSHDLRAMPDNDLRRAEMFLLATRGHLNAAIQRVERARGYTRGQEPTEKRNAP